MTSGVSGFLHERQPAGWLDSNRGRSQCGNRATGWPPRSERLTSRAFPMLVCRWPLRPAPTFPITPSHHPAAAAPATMASREELEAEALKLFTGIGLAEKTAQ